MNRTQLSAKISESTNVDEEDVARIVTATFEAIEATLVGGEEIQIYGFGKFQPRTKAGGTRRNPRTGESVEVPEKRGLRFQPSKKLKDAMNTE